MTKAISFTPGNKEVKSIVEQVRKQQITVGGHLQNILLAEKEAEGSKVKNVREYMESQRAYVWETWRASNLIQSLLLNIFIPEVILYRADEKSQFRRVLDGNQRLTSIYLFITDGFKLDLTKSIFPTFEIEGEQYTYESIQGKLFSQLPELFRDAILNYDLRMTTCNNCDEEQAEKFFVSMNAGVKVLKPAEVRNAAMGTATRRFIGEVLKSDWVLHTMTAKAATSNIGSEVVSQAITLMHNVSAVELSKENIDKVIYSFRDGGVPESMKEDITNVCNYLNEVTSIWIELKKKHDEQQTKKKGKGVSNYSTYKFSFFNKTHTVMLMIAADKAIKANVPVEEFATWSRKFFEFQSEDYKKGMDGKANELQNVDMRILAIQDEVSKLRKGESKVIFKKETEEQEANPVTHEDVLSIINEVMNETPNTNDSANISENTNSKIETEELGNELENDTVLGEDDAETLPDNSDASENEEIAGDSTQDDDGIEIKELTIDDIPETDGLEEQAS